MIEVVLKSRNEGIAQLVQDCADGKVPFTGDGSLWQKVRAMGYSCNGLYEMVYAAEKAAHTNT